MAGMVNDDQAAQVGTSTSDHSNKEQNCPLDQQEQTVSCEEGSCCVSESVTQEKSESGQTPNITQALAATPVHTQKVALELCWYCLKSQSTEGLNIPQLQVDSEDLTLSPSGERLNYQRDPRPHFGVAHSSRSVSFPLWDSDRPREMKRGEEKEEAVDSVSCCPHCHLGLPRDTLRWHELNCHRMECMGWWDIKGSEGYFYAAFKNQSDESISGDRK